MSQTPFDENPKVPPDLAPRLDSLASPDGAPGAEARPLLRVEDVSLIDSKGDAVFSAMTFDVRAGDRLYILGKRSAGKTALIHLLAGSIAPSAGTIARYCRISFPLGRLPHFAPNQPIGEYIRWTSEQYGGDADEIIEFFQQSQSFGFDLDELLGSLDKKAATRLGILLGLAIPFDVYLMDDYAPNLQDDPKLADLLRARGATKSLVFSSRAARGIKEQASRIAIISQANVTVYDDIRAGLDAYRAAISGE